MGIKWEDEIIERLLDILAYKKNNYQNKLDELDRKKEIEKILSKYPKEPFKGLIELELDEIMVLLSYFTKEEYDLEDLRLKKYWMIEASNNEALRETTRYKEANKLFIRLGDKLQEYLENLKDINISEKETSKKLDLVVSLNDALKEKNVIEDLSLYYPILSPSETLVEEDIYNFLIALSLNNINIIKEGIPYNKKNTRVSKEIRNYLKDILNKKIEFLEDEKQKYFIINDKLVMLTKLIDKIQDNYDAIIDVYPTEISDTMYELWTDEFIDDILDKLMIPITVIKGKKQGLNIDFNDEELNVIKEFINTLKQEEAKISEKEINEKKEREEKLTKEIESLSSTLNKLNGKQDEYFLKDDFDNLVNLLKEQNSFYEYIKNVIMILNNLNLKLSDVEDEIIEPNNIVEESKKEEILIQSNTLDNIQQIFSKYGYEYLNFPNKLLSKITKYTTTNHLEEMLNYIESHEELQFLKTYTQSKGNTEIDKKICDMKCSQLYYLLVYSNINILEHLIDIANEYAIDLRDIFSVPKVFVSINEDGTYENFVNNIKFIKDNYINSLVNIIQRDASVLGADSDLFRKNIELTEAYYMSIETDKNGAFPSPRALIANDFEYVMDRYIEAREYDYIERFRNQLETNYMIALRLKYLQLKGADFRQNAFVDINSQFDISMNDYLQDVSIQNIAVGINDELIKWLDSINEEKNIEKQKVQYIFNNIYISRLKVLKYYSTLLINNYPDKEKALLYSIVKDSYLTEEEFSTLKNLISNRKDN